MLRGSLVIGLALLSAQSARAQMNTPVLTEAEEIALARSGSTSRVAAAAATRVSSTAAGHPPM